MVNIEQVNNTTIVIVVIIISIIGCIYLLWKFKLKENNCKRIQTYNAHNSINIYSSLVKDKKLNQLFIKTAYNCCCTGNFKNDYVDLCALTNCNNQGARALHFEIYSLKNKPIIASSINQIPKYKEIYNYLDFFDTMNKVNTLFLKNNRSQAPLFIILDIYSNNTSLYDSIYKVLIDTFKQDFIYSPDQNVINLMNTSITLLSGKVVVMVNCQNANVMGNLLKKISYPLMVNDDAKIISYTEFLNYTDSVNNTYKEKYIDKSLILVPYKQTKNKNYDFISTGVKYGISFIAMNFQFNEQQLETYNDKLFNNQTGISNGSFTLKIYKLDNDTYYSPIIQANTRLGNLYDAINIKTNNINITTTYPELLKLL